MRRHRKKQLLVAIVAGCFTWGVLAAWNAVELYRSPDSLLFVEVRHPSEQLTNSGDLSVTAVTPWGSETSFRLERDGVWRIARIADSGKRPVTKVTVSRANSNTSADSLPLEGWQISLSSRFDADTWQEARAEKLESGLQLLPRTPSAPYSLIPSKRLVANWIGDMTFLRTCATGALQTTVLLALGVFAVRWLWWAAKPCGRDGGAAWDPGPRRAGADRRTASPEATGSPLSSPTDMARFTGAVAVHGAIAAIFVWFGVLEWPGLHHDASLFATPVFNVAKGNGWIFGGYPAALIRDFAPDYAWHGFVHVLVYGEWLGCDSWPRFSLWLGMTNALTFLVWSALSQSALRRARARFPRTGGFSFGLMAGMLALGLQGRPENLALLMIGGVLLLREAGALTGRSFEIALYVLGGILFCTSPALGALLAMAVLWRISMRYEGRDARRYWRELAVAGALAATTALVLLVFLQPYSVIERLRMIATDSAKTLDFSNHLFRFRPNAIDGITMAAPFWNIAVLGSGTLALLMLVRRRKWIGTLAFALASAWILPKLTDYGYASFLPLLLLFWATRATPGNGFLFRAEARPVFVALALLIPAAFWLPFLHKGLLSLYLAGGGVTASEARADVAKLVARADPQASSPLIVFHGPSRPSFVVLGDGGDRFVVGTPGFHDGWRSPALLEWETKLGSKPRYFLLPQRKDRPPPERLFVGSQRCTFTKNGWLDETPTLFGIPLRSALPGFQFALYEAHPASKNPSK